MKWLTDLLSNPLALILGFNIIIVIVGIGYMLINRLRVKHVILYFSEGERLYERLNIDAVTSKSLFCIKRGLRFIRTGTSYKNRLGNEVVWLAKRGTGYLFKLEDTNIESDLVGEDGKPINETRRVAKKIGTLWEGLEAILGDKMVNQFKDDVKVKLMNPDIYLTVELESGNEPYGLPKLDEEDIKNENSSRMSALIFSGIKEAMQEDMVKMIGLIGIGVALTLIAQSLGVL